MDEAKLLLKNAEPNLLRSASVWFLGNKYLNTVQSISKMKLVLRQKLEQKMNIAKPKILICFLFLVQVMPQQ